MSLLDDAHLFPRLPTPRSARACSSRRSTASVRERTEPLTARPRATPGGLPLPLPSIIPTLHLWKPPPKADATRLRAFYAGGRFNDHLHDERERAFDAALNDELRAAAGEGDGNNGNNGPVLGVDALVTLAVQKRADIEAHAAMADAMTPPPPALQAAAPPWWLMPQSFEGAAEAFDAQHGALSGRASRLAEALVHDSTSLDNQSALSGALADMARARFVKPPTPSWQVRPAQSPATSTEWSSSPRTRTHRRSFLPRPRDALSLLSCREGQPTLVNDSLDPLKPRPRPPRPPPRRGGVTSGAAAAAVWTARIRWSDSRDLYDTGQAETLRLQLDWSRALECQVCASSAADELMS